MWKRSLSLFLALLLTLAMFARATDLPHPEEPSDLGDRLERVVPKPHDDEDDEDHEEDRDEDEHEFPRPKPPLPTPEPEAPLPSPRVPLPSNPPLDHHEDDEDDDEYEYEYDDDFAYYGRVQATAPEIVVGNRTLVGSQEILKYLAPGMQVEVEGRIVDGRLHATEVHVLDPKSWAYFEGPNPGLGWSRVWYLDGRVWKTQAANPGPRVRLLACYRGRWLGLPPSLIPDFRPPEDGLWALEGLIWHGKIRWTQFQRVGRCDD